MTHLAESRSLFPQTDIPPAGKLPSYMRDHRKRLRDRLLAGGPAAVPDYELLELVLFRAIPIDDAGLYLYTYPHRLHGLAVTIALDLGVQLLNETVFRSLSMLIAIH